MEAAAIQPDLTEAFPESLRSHVREVLAVLPTSAQPRSPDDIGAITLHGKPLRIPARIYHPEPDWREIDSLPAVEQLIAACLYTRHHDGYVRQRALERAITIDETWVAPFVLQFLGEYVLELVTRVAAVLTGPPRHAFVSFLRENPGFLDLTTQRATSYWNEYHRTQFWRREDYPAFVALMTLRRWLSGDTAA
jgi:hypothetical protein